MLTLIKFSPLSLERRSVTRTVTRVENHAIPDLKPRWSHQTPGPPYSCSQHVILTPICTDHKRTPFQGALQKRRHRQNDHHVHSVGSSSTTSLVAMWSQPPSWSMHGIPYRHDTVRHRGMGRVVSSVRFLPAHLRWDAVLCLPNRDDGRQTEPLHPRIPEASAIDRHTQIDIQSSSRTRLLHGPRLGGRS